ncbi:MAG TPA: sporulation inhibitor of replication protein SirA [Bacillales bacterium]|nr:sporulation inhibitor of replication protein SirA [Bacillales bacterium]
MRHYDIFLIEDEVAETFFGEESKLFQLFCEAETNKSSVYHELLKKQVAYVTKPLNTNAVEQVIEREMRYRIGYYKVPGYHLLKAPAGNSRAELTFFQQRIHLDSQGSIECETAFFEVLRRCERCFWAVDYRNRRYGWLKPIKQRRYIKPSTV